MQQNRASMVSRRYIGIAIIAILGIVGGLLLWSPFRRALFGVSSSTQHVEVSGNVEAHQSVLSFTQVEAPIVFLPFEEGQSVSAGAVIARVDDSLYRRQLEIDRADLAVANHQIAVNQSNLLAAEKTVSNDRLDLAEKKRESLRASAQLQTGAVSQQAYDQAYTAAAQAEAVMDRDQALVRVANDNVSLARSNLAAAAAKLRLDAVTLSYTSMHAPFSGVLAVREAELGQLAGPGVPIFTLDDLDHVWLRAYINETNLGQIRLGEPASLTTDTYPNMVYHGRIAFIASQAEFTPKTVETHAERVTLVYRIRIDIDNPSHELLPGMPASATMSLLPSGKSP